MSTPAEWLGILDSIAEQYLLEDFAALRATLAELSARQQHHASAAELAQLAAALPLVEAQEQSARESFEQALASLRKQLSAEAPAAPASANFSVLSQDPELVGDFLMEAREHLGSIEQGLLIIEKDPAHRESLHSVFRSFHTIKGLAGFLDFARIQDVAHEVETILDMARNGQITMTPALVDLTLSGADFVQRETNRIEAELHGRTFDVPAPTELLAELRAAAQNPESPSMSRDQLESVALTEVVPPSSAPAELPTPTAGSKDAVEPKVAEYKAAESKAAEPKAAAESPARRAQSQETYSVRVDTAKLDYLLDMVGEMVIAESMVRLDPEIANSANARLQRNLLQLRRVTEEVQKVAMATRLVPVSALFQRVNRLVRDTSRKAGKLAEVEFFGEETQLDKTIIEELTDPIMHMVRNSIDHGLELPDQREAAGKSRVGKIQLKAYRQADHILIEIVDDGRGLNRERILNKALERNLIPEGSNLTDSEIYQLIFEPGFSTAEKVTDLSGRGVGMDVVKKQILKLRGKIDIQSRPGQGATFYLKLPLTLAIIEGLVVGVGRERFIVPIFSVQEMFRPAPGQVSSVQGRAEMVMVRNTLLPVIRLEDALQVVGRARASEDALMIVAEIEGRRFVLMVDEFIGKQEVVIKSLGGSLKNTPGIAGGAILGDGRVGLILDLEAIYRDRKAQDPAEVGEDGPAARTAFRKQSFTFSEAMAAV